MPERDSMSAIARDVIASMASETAPTTAPVAEPTAAETAPAAEVSAETAPAEPTPTPAPEQAPAPRTVPATKYNAVWLENERNAKALQEAQAKHSELETKLAQALAAQNPGAAAVANQTAESQADWIQQLLDEGAELPPKLVEQMRAQQARIDALEQQVGGHSQHFQSAAERQASVEFDAKFARLKELCPKWDDDRLLELIENGHGRHIVGDYQAIYGVAGQTQPTPAKAPATREAPPPRLDGPSTSGAKPAPEMETRDSYRQWVTSLTSQSTH